MDLKTINVAQMCYSWISTDLFWVILSVACLVNSWLFSKFLLGFERWGLVCSISSPKLGLFENTLESIVSIKRSPFSCSYHFLATDIFQSSYILNKK